VAPLAPNMDTFITILSSCDVPFSSVYSGLLFKIATLYLAAIELFVADSHETVGLFLGHPRSLF
jgi:hypothetical protein